ncbi:MAG TPA: molybdopterin-dependent oxidoreductase, partial [Burkholderiaceae bacterium]|nr:molybdopterin-dependent oxidoreductase [Burkholderiaceae bacterium]
MGASRKVPIYCYQCVAGPDLLTVEVENGVATRVESNYDISSQHPGGGRVCVKAYGLVQKTYNPNRIRQPMKRTNPNKGRNEDPGFVPIGWDEALDIVGAKLREIR